MRTPSKLRDQKTILSIIFLLTLLSLTVIIRAIEAEQIVFYDNFNNYEARTYPGRDGPDIWVQESLTPATYSIAGGAYKIQSSGGVFSSKVILDYYRVFSKPWPPSYEGPSDYLFAVGIKIDSKGGGIIFRAMPGSQERYWTHYEVRVMKDTMKVTLASVYEDPTNPSEAVLRTVDFPSDVDINSVFRLSVRVQGSSIQVYIADKRVIDITSTLNPTGGVGLMTCGGCEASFDWAELDILTTTVTSTVTSTTTMTTTSTVTSTTTMPPSTITTTATETTTETVATTVTRTTTMTTTLMTTTTVAAETITETVTETVTTISTAPSETITITQATTVPGAATTQTIKETVTSISTVTVIERVTGRCLIATAAFGSEIAPQVQALREFRDGFVMETFAGENFMKAFHAFYYSWSPYIAQAEHENEYLRTFIRISIYPLLWILDISKLSAEPFSAMPELAVLIGGLIASSLIGLVYISPIVLAMTLIVKHKVRRIDLNLVYLSIILMIGLGLFILAEVMASSLLMMVASSIIVLSVMALASIAPMRILLLKKKS
ncbi:MAG: CFI-box-CTERM domain-containing protein [Candidatus Caldarchaeales archaeon]